MAEYNNPWISIADLLSSVVIVLLVMLLFFSLIPKLNEDITKEDMMKEISESLVEFEREDVLKVVEEQMLIELSEFSFERGSACLDDRSEAVFSRLAPLIEENLLTFKKLSILIEGHSDSRPVNGVINSCGYFENNIQLSTLRAINVRGELLGRFEIGNLQNRIGASGYGATRLKNSEDPLSIENRRVDIRLIFATD